MISVGAILGANTRFLVYKKLQKLDINNNLIILIINIFASFTLGLFLSVLWDNEVTNFSSQLVSLVSIGFLGSLSTFSTFVYDLFELCTQFEFFKALKIFFMALSLGIIAAVLGYLFGNL